MEFNDDQVRQLKAKLTSGMSRRATPMGRLCIMLKGGMPLRRSIAYLGSMPGIAEQSPPPACTMKVMEDPILRLMSPKYGYRACWKNHHSARRLRHGRRSSADARTSS